MNESVSNHERNELRKAIVHSYKYKAKPEDFQEYVQKLENFHETLSPKELEIIKSNFFQDVQETSSRIYGIAETELDSLEKIEVRKDKIGLDDHRLEISDEVLALFKKELEEKKITVEASNPEGKYMKAFYTVLHRYKDFLSGIHIVVAEKELKKTFTMTVEPFRKEIDGKPSYTVNINTNEKAKKNAQDFTYENYIGMFSHELGHIKDYEERGKLGRLGFLFKYSLSYLTQKKWIKELEDKIDDVAVENGFGVQLHDTRHKLKESYSPKQQQLKEKAYSHPQALLSKMIETNKYTSDLQYLKTGTFEKLSARENVMNSIVQYQEKYKKNEKIYDYCNELLKKLVKAKDDQQVQKVQSEFIYGFDTFYKDEDYKKKILDAVIKLEGVATTHQQEIENLKNKLSHLDARSYEQFLDIESKLLEIYKSHRSEQNKIDFFENSQDPMKNGEKPVGKRQWLTPKKYKIYKDSPERMNQYKEEVEEVLTLLKSGELEKIQRNLERKFGEKKAEKIISSLCENLKDCKNDDHFILQAIAVWQILKVRRLLLGLQGIKKGLWPPNERFSDFFKEEARPTCTSVNVLTKEMAKMFGVELEIKVQDAIYFKPSFSIIPSGHRRSVYKEGTSEERIVDTVWGGGHAGIFQKDKYYKLFPVHIPGPQQKNKS